MHEKKLEKKTAIVDCVKMLIFRSSANCKQCGVVKYFPVKQKVSK